MTCPTVDDMPNTVHMMEKGHQSVPYQLFVSKADEYVSMFIHFITWPILEDNTGIIIIMEIGQQTVPYQFLVCLKVRDLFRNSIPTR